MIRQPNHNSILEMNVLCVDKQVGDIFGTVGLQTSNEGDTRPVQPSVEQPGKKQVGRKRMELSQDELFAKKQKRVECNRQQGRLYRQSAHGKATIKAYLDNVSQFCFLMS